MLGRSRGSDELFDCPMIFHAWRGLDAGTNVNGVRPDSCDGVAKVLRIQTTRENKKSRQRKRCSCKRPVASQSCAAAQFRMMRIKDHVAFEEGTDIFRLN
jgi:hypothetical protein